MGRCRTLVPYGRLPRATPGAALPQSGGSLCRFRTENCGGGHAGSRAALYARGHPPAERDWQTRYATTPSYQIPASRSCFESYVWFPATQSLELRSSQTLASGQRIGSLASERSSAILRSPLVAESVLCVTLCWI